MNTKQNNFFSEFNSNEFGLNICGKNDITGTEHIIGPNNDNGNIIRKF